jgi:ketosteroid isomerase-like protein
MYKSAVKWMIRRNVRALRSGDLGPLLSGYADDALLVFPGVSSWSGEHKGRSAIEQFLTRFVSVGLFGEVEEIVVNGPPWRTTICVVFVDMAKDSAGNVVYNNRVVLFARAKWGKVTYQEDFLDTQRVEAFDRYLESNTPKMPG